MSETTRSGWKNEPTKFFPYLLLIPVFPPIEESTCASKVVGMLINFIPLLNILAAKPVISPVIPPPKEIMQSPLLKLFTKSLSKILFTLSWFLFISLGLNKWMDFVLHEIFFF